MFRPNRSHLLVAVILLGTLAMGASPAQAWWGGGWGHSYGWYGGYYSPHYSYGSCCAPCCSTGYYSGDWHVGYRPGPVRRVLFGPHRWYWSGSPYYYGGYRCCTSVVLSESEPSLGAGTPTSEPTLAPSLPPAGPGPSAPGPEPTPPEPTPAPPSPTTDVGPAREGGAQISIFVPAGAKVVINGLETKSTGTQREYISYGLKPGHAYRYEIRAQIVRNGRQIEDARTVYLSVGAREQVAFSLDPGTQEAIATLW
ncbi:MAG: TIGR03000 domain-containing protein [Planctomycetota bacterium]